MRPIPFLSAALAFALALSGSGALHAEGLRQSIQFPKGQSSATLSASVIRGDTDRYDLVARKGQTMTVRIASEEDNAAFVIYRPGATVKVEDGMSFLEGPTLEGAGEGDDAMSWTGTLPSSGKYPIEVGGTRGNASYQLTVTIQ